MPPKAQLLGAGFYWSRGLLGDDVIGALRRNFDAVAAPGERIWNMDSLAPLIQSKAFANSLGDLGIAGRIVRATLFIKSSDQNWSIGWHQDRVIAVKSRQDVAGYSRWTQKDNVWHCEPPEAILNQMSFARIFLDDENTHSGAMEYVEGSHQVRIDDDAARDKLIAASSIHATQAKAGDIFFAKMPLLHRSMPSKTTTPRRVIRLDLCNSELPKPLEWAVAAKSNTVAH